MAEQEDELELKKRARRRLVGAASFALLAVAVLPLVMDEDAPPLGADIPVRIPGQDESRPPPQAVSRAAPRPAEAESAAGTARSPGAPVPEGQAGAQAADAGSPAADSPRPTAPPTTTAPPTAQQPDAKRAQAILDDRQPPPQQYVLLIGAYAQASNVSALTARLAEIGIKTYTETLDMPQGRRTRVRAGPFASREAALQAQEKMKRIGVNGQLAARP